MDTENLMVKIINKCDLYFDGEIISKEHLIKIYTEFICNTIVEKNHNVGIMLHTGSICFDIVSIIMAVLTNLKFNESDADEVIASLNVGDIVLYGNNRHTFNGYERKKFSDVYENYVVLLQNNGDTTFVPPKKIHLISPYKGKSKRMDGRGLRKQNSNRIDFISKVFDLPIKEIPCIIDTSSVIVMPRENFEKIEDGLEIYYDVDKSIKLLDIVSASYFTENDEYTYRGNPGKTEPILKITNRISVARDLIINKVNNRIIGLNVLGFESITRGRTELPELMNRRSLKYVFIAYHIDSENGESIIAECDEANVIACTKDFLLSNSLPTIIPNSITIELNRQVENVINKEISPIIIKTEKTWNDYKDLKKALFFIKKSELVSENLEQFIIHAHSLLNLFLTAVFTISSMEYLISTGKLDVLSPQIQIDNLKKLMDEFHGDIKIKAQYIVNQLELLYIENIDFCKKEDILNDLLNSNTDKKIAIIIPKAYYFNIIYAAENEKLISKNKKITISTANKFDNEILYDMIIVVGDFKGKRFDTFKTKASSLIIPIIYDFENNIFKFRMKSAAKIENIYNEKSKIPIVYDEKHGDLSYDNSDVKDDEIFEIETISNDLSFYVERLNEIDAIRHVCAGVHSSGTTVEVASIATFSDGEKAFFTKSYKAYVFDSAKEDVREIAAESLSPGDTLVFTNNDHFTKDIVKQIFGSLLDEKILDNEIAIAYEKSNRWKDVLRNFMHQNDISYSGISRLFQINGCIRGEQSIRSWLDDDSHIIGPKDEEPLICLAVITGDKEMLDKTSEYYSAIKTVRSVRIKILKMIGISIINKLKGKSPEKDIFLETVYSNVDNLAKMLQLETITEVEQKLQAPINMVNRPIML